MGIARVELAGAFHSMKQFSVPVSNQVSVRKLWNKPEDVISEDFLVLSPNETHLQKYKIINCSGAYFLLGLYTTRMESDVVCN